LTSKSSRNSKLPNDAAAASPAPQPHASRAPLIAGVVALVVILAAGAWFAFRRAGAVAGGSEPPQDIILVTIDTLRADAISFTGSTKSKTPFIDELASGGVYFRHAHSHNVVTLPSHTNILTGLLPYQHGVRENAGFVLDPKHHTVAAYLKKAGYATGAFIAAFPLDARFGLGADFDVYNDEYREATKPTAFVVPERPASEVFTAAQSWYDSVAGRKRFMWVHLYEPHAPYAPPEKYREQYKDHPYYGEVAGVDESLAGFLRPILEKNPNTLVILTGDHGEGMSEHGEVTHGVFAYEETLHVPLLVYQKGRVKPHVEDRYVRHVDIAPTILAAVGIPQPAEMTGESLLSVEKPRDTYFEALTPNINLGWAPLIGMIHEGHKYIDLPIAELYDLAKDPLEKKNILSENRRMTTKIRGLLAEGAPKLGKIERNLNPADAKKLMSLGYLAGTAQAKETYTERDDPKNVVHLYTIMMNAIATYQKGELQEAIKQARGLVEERPEMAMARDLLAFLLQESEDPKAAEEVIRQAVATGQASDVMRKRLGMILSETGRAAEAVKVLEPFASSNDPDLLNAYGIALADVGQMQQAVQQFQRALQIDHTNATAFQNLGVVALRIENLPAAEQYLNRALSLNDRMPLALNSLGVVYAKKGDIPRALQLWKNAVAIDPKQYDTLFNIGMAAGNIGDRVDAARALNQFIRTAPPERYAADIEKAKAALASLR
jgi:arylsulfatase A-like enzyme/Flp pilus assembly protein TadD